MTQFRLLYRESLFRVVDLELLSADASDGATKLLGRFAALLIMLSLFMAAHALEFARKRAPGPLDACGYEHFLIATTMLVVGLFAVLSWEAMFPDRRDLLVLGPLPVRAWTLFAAKASALATALGLAILLLHAAAGLVWPFALAGQSEAAFPVREFFRSLAAYWIAMTGAGAFVFCSVLGFQGLAAQLLPRRAFLRVSSFLQLAVFCILVGLYLLQPLLPGVPDVLQAARGGLLSRSPSYWFLGWFQQWNGSPSLATLGRRASLGLIVAASAGVAAYALCYCRTLRKIVEEPDIVPDARGRLRLRRFGSTVPVAIALFAARVLSRSRLHRLLIAFYLGMGFAFLVVLLRTAPGESGGVPLLTACAVILAFSSLGTRITFTIPLDLRANWVFRITAVRSRAECLAGCRLALLLLSAGPVWTISAIVLLHLLPWRLAAACLAILALAALAIAEVCLLGFHKIPFTCSYLPGKSQVHLAVLGAAYMLWVIGPEARYERRFLEDPASFAVVLLGLAAVWTCAYWRNRAQARSEPGEVRFDELEDPAVQGLGLNRDGSWEIGGDI